MPQTKDLEKLREMLIKETAEKVKKTFQSKEFHIIKAISCYEDMHKVYNLLAEHAIDWYSLHFPELKRIVENNEEILKCILLGNRKNYSSKTISFCKNAEAILKAANESIGAEIDEASLKQIQHITKLALDCKKEIGEIKKYIENEMQNIAPNFTELCGAILAAKLLAAAGSIKKLAMLPSSTLQLLGAEKALFRHLRKKTKPPKYGYILQHPLIKSLPKDKRGKMARSLAAKLSIAVKEDFFGKGKIAEKLKVELEKRFRKLKD